MSYICPTCGKKKHLLMNQIIFGKSKKQPTLLGNLVTSTVQAAFTLGSNDAGIYQLRLRSALM